MNTLSSSLEALSQAEHFSLQSFLNCYLRESRNYEVLAVGDIKHPLPESWQGRISHVVRTTLEPLATTLFIGVSYLSASERHQLLTPVKLRVADEWKSLELHAVLSLMLGDLKYRAQGDDASDTGSEVLARVLNSYRNMARYFEHSEQLDKAYGETVDFLTAEQALVIGHQMHPVPKSREGFSDSEQLLYAPETSSGFALSYFLVRPDVVVSDSALTASANELVRHEALNDVVVDDEQQSLLEEYADYQLLPLHPWQAAYVAELPAVQKAIDQELIVPLGQCGPAYFPTTSVRTVFNPKGRFMYKCSLNVAITNSVRKNMFRELLRGMESERLWQSPLGDELKAQFPSFQTVGDPAWMALKLDGEVLNETAIILRHNPVFNQPDNNVSNLAMLCQDHPLGQPNRLHTLVSALAEREGVSTAQAAQQWFGKFMQVTMNPVLWIYHHYGIAFEAHQQNTLLEIKDLMPEKFYYRDNQGCFYITDFYEPLLEYFPSLAEVSESCGPVEFVDHHFIYYFFINNVFGVINALGTAGLIDEAVLYEDLRNWLSEFAGRLGKPSTLITALLNAEKLPCKGNLLTRFAGLDELEAPVEAQSVYFEIDNPLLTNARDLPLADAV